jgi:hypothetical protein
VPSSAFSGWGAAAPPRARANAPACGSPSSLPAAAGAGPSAGPIGCVQRRSLGDEDAASPPRWRQACSDCAVCCDADPPLGCPVTRLEDRDGPPATLRAEKVPSASSLSIALSSSASARNVLGQACSFSSWLSRLASSAFIPP